MKKALLAVGVLALIISGCAKKTGKRFEILRSHPWQLVSKTVNGVDQPLEECERGNIWVFSADETGYEGNISCGDTLQNINDTTTNNNNNNDTTIIQQKQTQATAGTGRVNFYWSVTGDQKYVYLRHFGPFDDYPVWEVQTMDSKGFVVKGLDIVNGVNYAYEKRFIAK